MVLEILWFLLLLLFSFLNKWVLQAKIWEQVAKIADDIQHQILTAPPPLPMLELLQ